jgi:hypothetical protein
MIFIVNNVLWKPSLVLLGFFFIGQLSAAELKYFIKLNYWNRYCKYSGNDKTVLMYVNTIMTLLLIDYHD